MRRMRIAILIVSLVAVGATTPPGAAYASDPSQQSGYNQYAPVIPTVGGPSVPHIQGRTGSSPTSNPQAGGGSPVGTSEAPGSVAASLPAAGQSAFEGVLGSTSPHAAQSLRYRSGAAPTSQAPTQSHSAAPGGQGATGQGGASSRESSTQHMPSFLSAAGNALGGDLLVPVLAVVGLAAAALIRVKRRQP